MPLSHPAPAKHPSNNLSKLFRILPLTPTAFLAAFLLSACGYQLGEIRPTPTRSVRTIAVPIVKNHTYIPRASALLTESLLAALQSDGTFSAAHPARADALLLVTLTRADRYPIRSAASNYLQTTEFELTLQARYELRDRLSNALLHSGIAQASANFFPTGDLTTDERQAFSIAAQRLAANLIRSLSEGW